MKKQTLLGAVALTTIIVAGGANAGTLTATGTAGATVDKAVVLAADFTAAAASEGVIGLNLQPSVGAILPSGNAILTVNLVGGATFAEAVTAGAVLTNGACAPTTTVSSGGAEGSKTVSFLVSNLNGCTNTPADNLQFEIPVKLDGTTTAVNVEAGLKTELGTPIDGGVVSTYDSTAKTNLIDFKNAISVEVVADTVATYATLTSKFKALSDGALGTVKVDVAAYGQGIDDLTKVTAPANVTATKLTVKGDFSTVDIFAGATKFVEATAGAGTATVTAPGGAVTHSITADEQAGTPVIKASTYTVSAALTAAGYRASALTVAATPIQSITREGASYLLPWVASGALSTTSTSNTVVRLSNIGTAATGPVSVELLTSSAGVAASTALVPVAASIAKGGELVLTSASLQAALGADFGRGDIRVTVEGQPSDLIVRRFVQSTVNGALSEVSLGRTNFGASTGAEPLN